MIQATLRPAAMADEGPKGALSEEAAQQAAARGGARVRVDFKSGACWCAVVGYQPPRGKRPARLLVDVTGIEVAVALEDVREVVG